MHTYTHCAHIINIQTYAPNKPESSVLCTASMTTAPAPSPNKIHVPAQLALVSLI